MGALQDEQLKAVAAAVTEAEKKSGGEIATAIIAESDDYGFRELIAAIVVGVITFSVLTLFAPAIEETLARGIWGYQSWMLLAVVGSTSMVVGGLIYFLVQIPALDRLIISRAVMEEAVRRRARRHFMESGVYDTRDRTGVLIFISLLERRVELIADRGISERVPQERWDAIVNALIQGIRRGETGSALVEAVRAVGDVLGEHVQRRDDDTNELANRPIELERGS